MEAKLDDKILVDNGTKRNPKQMEGHASLMYSTEEAKHHHTFPLELLQFIVSQGNEQFTFCLWKNREIQQLEL